MNSSVRPRLVRQLPTVTFRWFGPSKGGAWVWQTLGSHPTREVPPSEALPLAWRLASAAETILGALAAFHHHRLFVTGHPASLCGRRCITASAKHCLEVGNQAKKTETVRQMQSCICSCSGLRCVPQRDPGSHCGANDDVLVPGRTRTTTPGDRERGFGSGCRIFGRKLFPGSVSPTCTLLSRGARFSDHRPPLHQKWRLPASRSRCCITGHEARSRPVRQKDVLAEDRAACRSAAHKHARGGETGSRGVMASAPSPE